MTLVQWSPNRTSIFDDFNNLFSSTIRNNWNSNDEETDYWAPPVDVKEDDKEYTIMVDLPGLSKNDVTNKIKNNLLTVNSNQGSKTEVENETFHYRERRNGNFHRTFKIPDIVEQKKVVASFENGILLIALPKSKESVPNELEIKIK